MSDIIEVTDQNFETEVLQSDKPAVIDFWAEWCAPCRQIAPIIHELAGEYGDQVKIVKMDIETNEEMDRIEIPEPHPEPHGLSAYRAGSWIYCDATSGWVAEIQLN